jgi:hypothetical protein
MVQKPKKAIRKLVTLPLELALEVDRFRQESSATSESDALKVLIAWGLTRQDKPQDLFERCKRATDNGSTIGDVITSVVADHPLVDRSIVGVQALDVYLKSRDLDEEHQTRFRFKREEKAWIVEITDDHGRTWSLAHYAARKTKGQPPPPEKDGMSDDMSGGPASGGRPASRAGKAELDDDIPF